MNKILICYFSASGTTKKVAEKISSLLNSDLYEIEPKEKYTEADLNWMDKNSRSSLEMSDKSSRPKIVRTVENIERYNKIIIGFPVWWHTAPTIINTFIEENDLIGKEIYIFVTSGGSSFGGSLKDLKNTYPDINFVNGKRLNVNDNQEELINWLS